jgi:hypothetical protein
MANTFEEKKAKRQEDEVKRHHNIDGDWPESLTPKQISSLHFPNDAESASLLLEMIEEAANKGVIEFNDILITPPNLPPEYLNSEYSINPNTGTFEQITSEIPASASDWITALRERVTNQSPRTLAVKSKSINFIQLLERFNNGLPRRWAYYALGSGLEPTLSYNATPLIPRSSYAAWQDKPTIPSDSHLFYWLSFFDIAGDLVTNGIEGQQTSHQPEILPDAGAGLLGSGTELVYQ